MSKRRRRSTYNCNINKKQKTKKAIRTCTRRSYEHVYVHNLRAQVVIFRILDFSRSRSRTIMFPILDAIAAPPRLGNDHTPHSHLNFCVTSCVCVDTRSDQRDRRQPRDLSRCCRRVSPVVAATKTQKLSTTGSQAQFP